ncbi:T-cell immunoglobulin and mucin domain-containing protein 4-like isoform X1 [Brachyistius frenatus]|uniref:T-cell immunoglobulin and mucin domain-containing protein 4-like isoform X1 n=1 Tax=Brachyistius frenatus TaxID=100188 RepID=UPI0037E8AD71
MKLVLLLALLTASECDKMSVHVGAGQNVTLPCQYDIKYHKELLACWSRGNIPNSGCGSPPLISSDGFKVTDGGSGRFQLQGRLDEGDVSLTILNATEGDAGRYGCRVEIPGWFNDDKHHFDLTIDGAPHTTGSPASDTETPTELTEPTTAGQTAGHMTSTESRLTSSFDAVGSIEEDSTVAVVLLCVLFGSVVLIIAGGLVIIARRHLNKPAWLQVGALVQFSSTSSSLQLHRRVSVAENIYQIDEGGNGGVYESCP